MKSINSKAFFLVILIFCSSIPLVSAPECENRIAYNRPDSYDVRVGSVTTGNLTSLFYVDGNVLNISETTGTPAYDIRLNYTLSTPITEENLTDARLSFFANYEGSITHEVVLEIWNFTGSEWKEIARILDSDTYDFTNCTRRFSEMQGCFNDQNQVWLRIDHISPGNINHVFSIDYAVIEITYLWQKPHTPAAYAEILNPITDDRWITSNTDAGYNDSFKAYSLNWTGNGGYENFTAANWTTHYGAGDLTITSDKVDVSNYDRVDPLAFSYETHPRSTAGKWDGSMFFTLHVSNIESVPLVYLAYPVYWANNNDYSGWVPVQSGGGSGYGLRIYSPSNQGSDYGLMLQELDAGTEYNNWLLQTGLSVGTTYYLNFTKSGTVLYGSIYTDSDYTTQLVNATHTLQQDHTGVDDFYGALGQDAGSGSRDISYYIEKLKWNTLSGGYANQGVIYSSNLMENTTVAADLFLVNYTNPATSTGVSVEFSDDNVTWQRQTDLCAAYQEGIYVGDLNLNPLYVRFNLNTSNSLQTPLINNYRVLYPVDCNGTGGNGLIFGDINWFLIFIWGVLILGSVLMKAEQKQPLMLFASVVGFIAGIFIVSESFYVGLFVVFINVALLIMSAIQGE